MRNLDLAYSLQIKNADGALSFDSGVRPGHSFTKQFSQLMFNSVPFWLSAFSPQSMTAIDGSSVTFVGDNSTAPMYYRVNAGTTTSTYGILVGTSTAAESINDTALGTQIAHGTGAGQIQYGAVTFAAPSTTATTTTFRITRVFTNGSGGTVTVQEIGLATSGQGVFVTVGNNKKFLIIRDLTGAVAVNNGQQLTVNYDLTTTI